MGKTHEIRRKQSAYGDEGIHYTFSGNKVPARKWETCKSLFQIKECVEKKLESSFNFCLINRYKDGNDRIGYHRDSDKQLIDESDIAMISLGNEREFVLKHRSLHNTKGTFDDDDFTKEKDNGIVKITVKSGSLLVMKHPTNEFWYHSLPKRAKAKDVRVSLTFRQMKVKL